MEVRERGTRACCGCGGEGRAEMEELRAEDATPFIRTADQIVGGWVSRRERDGGRDSGRDGERGGRRTGGEGVRRSDS